MLAPNSVKTEIFQFFYYQTTGVTFIHPIIPQFFRNDLVILQRQQNNIWPI